MSKAFIVSGNAAAEEVVAPAPETDVGFCCRLAEEVVIPLLALASWSAAVNCSCCAIDCNCEASEVFPEA